MRATRIALAVLLMGVAAGATTAPAQAATTPRCKAGQALWKVEGRQRCVRSRALGKGAVRPGAATLTQYAITLGTADAPRGREAVSASLRRALRRQAARIATIAGNAETRLRATAGAARHGLRADTPASYSQPLRLGGGDAAVTGKLTASVDAAKGLGMGVEATVKNGRDSATLKVDLQLGLGAGAQSVCPDATGRVVIRDRTSFKTTTIQRRGGRVTGARTTGADVTTETVGQNGDDGFLEHISTTQTTDSHVYERGYTYDATTKVALGGATSATPALEGTPSTEARYRSPSTSRATERAIERELASRAPSEPEPSKSLAESARRERDHLVELSKRWTALDLNYCVSIVWDPETPGRVDPGQSLPINGKLKLRDGSFAAASWTVTEVSVGGFGGSGPAGPGGQTFTAVGAAPVNNETVRAAVIAASKAGRTQRSWLARAAEFPATITATLAQSERTGGTGFEQSFAFTMTARWTRISLDTAPDGTRTAEYSLVEATVPQGHWRSAAGCTWEGDVSGGTPKAGTVDLVAAPDGTVRYGFSAEVDLGRRAFPLTAGPPGCPGSTDPTQINALVQGRRAPDSSLYDAPAGALQGSAFHVARTGVTDSVGAQGGHEVTIDWTLDGS